MGRKSGSGIRIEKWGSDINIPDPQHWLVIRMQEGKNSSPNVKMMSWIFSMGLQKCIGTYLLRNMQVLQGGPETNMLSSANLFLPCFCLVEYSEKRIDPDP
jgi:hypothetical protein